MASKTEASFEKVKGGKLVFKGGLGVDKVITKKKKQKSKKAKEGETIVGGGEGAKQEGAAEGEEEVDTGIGYAPDGRKKTAKYEEMFPFESRKFGYVEPKAVKTREDALDEREKKKADRHCK